MVIAVKFEVQKSMMSNLIFLYGKFTVWQSETYEIQTILSRACCGTFVPGAEGSSFACLLSHPEVATDLLVCFFAKIT